MKLICLVALIAACGCTKVTITTEAEPFAGYKITQYEGDGSQSYRVKTWVYCQNDYISFTDPESGRMIWLSGTIKIESIP